MRLILIRHGQTQSNLEHIIDTAVPGPGLTELGRTQADALPTALAGERIDAIFASTQLRSQQTAAPLAATRDLPVNVRAGIREVEAGEHEGRRDRVSIHDFVSVELGWVRGEVDVRMPGAQTGTETMARFDEVVAEAHSAGHEAVVFVSHGSMIRTWCGIRTDNVDVGFVYRNPLYNTGVVIVEGTPADGWTTVLWQERTVALS
jgi:broad specificity phosphatase PhoE